MDGTGERVRWSHEFIIWAGDEHFVPLHWADVKIFHSIRANLHRLTQQCDTEGQQYNLGLSSGHHEYVYQILR